MSSFNLARLRLLSLLCLLPGLAGLIFASMVSMNYRNTLPRIPIPEESRMIPRNINGFVVYQTEDENRDLNLLEYSSVAIFVIGLGAGLVYLRKWGIARALEAEDDEFVAEEN